MLSLIIEHFDDISKWSIIEYTHLSHHCKQNNINLIITKYSGTIPFADCKTQSITEIHSSFKFDILVLADLNGNQSLEEDVELHNSELNIGIVIGGMLGEDPPVDREGNLRLIPNIRCRTMTDLHLPTDVAGICAIKLLKDNWSISTLQQNLLFPIEFIVSKYEEHFLPFAYFKQSAFNYSLDTMEIINATKSKIVFGKGLKMEIRNQ